MPYLAPSITDFWHRWHMTLSTWLRDYLYIPLGGSRGGKLATLRNLMLTMLLGGLWHGAQWTFVAWGGLSRRAALRRARVRDRAGGGRAARARRRAHRAHIHAGHAGLGAFPRADLRRGAGRYRALVVAGGGAPCSAGLAGVLAAGLVAFRRAAPRGGRVAVYGLRVAGLRPLTQRRPSAGCWSS